jgi:BRCT domain type II-containing protein
LRILSVAESPAIAARLTEDELSKAKSFKEVHLFTYGGFGIYEKVWDNGVFYGNVGPASTAPLVDWYFPPQPPPFKKSVVVVQGVGSKDKETTKAAVEARGGRVRTTISNLTTVLVVTDGLDDTSKFQQAVKKGLPCITLSGMLAAISATPVAGGSMASGGNSSSSSSSFSSSSSMVDEAKNDIVTRKRGRQVPESTCLLTEGVKLYDDFNDEDDENDMGVQNGLGNSRSNNNKNGETKAKVSKKKR